MIKKFQIKGFSLLEMVIAMTLAAGLLVFYMKMQTQQAKSGLTAKVNQETETFFADFRAIIDRPGFCSKSLQDSTFSNNKELAIKTIKGPLGDIRYQVGEVYGNKYLKLNSIKLKNFKADDLEGREGVATLEISIEKLAKVYGGKMIKKTMEISVSRDQSQKIIGCGALGYNHDSSLQIVLPTTTSVIEPPSAEQTQMIIKEMQKTIEMIKQNENNENE